MLFNPRDPGQTLVSKHSVSQASIHRKIIQNPQSLQTCIKLDNRYKGVSRALAQNSGCKCFKVQVIMSMKYVE